MISHISTDLISGSDSGLSAIQVQADVQLIADFDTLMYSNYDLTNIKRKLLFTMMICCIRARISAILDVYDMFEFG
jgi:hypothetical protein